MLGWARGHLSVPFSSSWTPIPNPALPSRGARRPAGAARCQRGRPGRRQRSGGGRGDQPRPTAPAGPEGAEGSLHLSLLQGQRGEVRLRAGQLLLPGSASLPELRFGMYLMGKGWNLALCHPFVGWGWEWGKRRRTKRVLQLPPRRRGCSNSRPHALLGALGIQVKKSSTSATSRAAGRCTAKPPTCGPTCGGTRGSGPSSAGGCCAGSASPAPMSCRGTSARTRVRPGVGGGVGGSVLLGSPSGGLGALLWAFCWGEGK